VLTHQGKSVTQVHNFSGFDIDATQLNVLNWGIKHRALSVNVPDELLRSCLDDALRLIELRAFFGASGTEDRSKIHMKFRLPNKDWKPVWPKGEPPWLALSRAALYAEMAERCPRINTAGCGAFANLSWVEKYAINSLKDNPKFAVIGCDKNLGVALVTHEYLMAEALVHFSDAATYEKVAAVDSTLILHELDHIVSLCYNVGENQDRRLGGWKKEYAVFAHFITKFSTSAVIPKAKFLAKIHKPSDNPLHPFSCRLLVCSTRWHTTAIAQVVHHLLFPVVVKQPSFCGSSLSLIRTLSTQSFPADCILFTLDVKALYPSIDLALALPLIEEYLISINFVHVELVMTGLSFIHKFTFVRWQQEVYRQIAGTSMGSGAAPALACLYLSILELSLFSPEGRFLSSACCNGFAPLLFRRYIDDAGGIWPNDMRSLELFIELLQNLARPSISWTWVISTSSINFLDITISKGAEFGETGLFEISQYQKAANLYQYIMPTSGHVRQSFRNLVIGETIRLLRCSSVESSYIEGLALLKSRLLRRRYNEMEIVNIFRRFPHSKRMFVLFGSSSKDSSAAVTPPTIRVILPLSVQTVALLKRKAPLLSSVVPPEVGSVHVGFKLGPSLAKLLVSKG
jgi:hypothetical protein